MSFEKDYNMGLAQFGLMFYLKYSFKKPVFALLDLKFSCVESEEKLREIVKKLMGRGYICRSSRPKDWVEDKYTGLTKNIKRNFYRWSEIEDKCREIEKRECEKNNSLSKKPLNVD